MNLDLLKLQVTSSKFQQLRNDQYPRCFRNKGAYVAKAQHVSCRVEGSGTVKPHWLNKLPSLLVRVFNHDRITTQRGFTHYSQVSRLVASPTMSTFQSCLVQSDHYTTQSRQLISHFTIKQETKVRSRFHRTWLFSRITLFQRVITTLPRNDFQCTMSMLWAEPQCHGNWKVGELITTCPRNFQVMVICQGCCYQFRMVIPGIRNT